MGIRGDETMNIDSNPGNVAGSAPPEKRSITKKFQTEEAVLFTLLVLSTVGIGLTNFRPNVGFWYWVCMVPVFGATSIYLGWSKARKRGEGVSRVVSTQVLHWVGLLAAVILIYFLFKNTGRIDNNQFALTTLLALALATFLAGVHFDWRFMVVGVVLGAVVGGAAFVQQVLWMIVLPIGAAIFLAVFWWQRKS